ncbi:uncharacterized protein M421DRAFT_4085 [Didymella exigua CBS 183.55]|uniref:PinX1-related protein 1 n=1 Tax=Didymella exigua CBS 183.55 TaxID=1150837 RepID=A0A6A5RMI2_9PLEO|nr:uncharacterized protein M421DRAFT_4085 [Didymella exigua CBS 183.55]KAF1929625.1 hypothetical protein M421DRAFT_4085 [Didymella exigua CBS 183.55]
MGLAQQKNRSKISNDPQNNHWAHNTERFGHKILAAQGWKTGDTLGAKDAAHEAHYTQASQSHIRVFLKDDNLGLGAKRGSERAENFGLAGLESILGRLNGREEEVKKEEARREEIEKRAYVYRKFGSMNFISGGFLVGDKLVPRAEVKLESTELKIKEESDSDNESSKKRKRDVADASEEGSSEQKLKRKKKSMSLREEADKQDKKAKKDKKDKKEKKEKKEKKDKSSKKIKKENASSDPEPMSDDAPTPASDPEPLTDKARRKAEKKARKEEKRLKKALKKAAKEARKSKDSADDSSSDSDEDDATPSSSVPVTGTSTPSFVPRGVQTARHRHIMMKKRASMDPQALKEIFMIKTPVA